MGIAELIGDSIKGDIHADEIGAQAFNELVEELEPREREKVESGNPVASGLPLPDGRLYRLAWFPWHRGGTVGYTLVSPPASR